MTEPLLHSTTKQQIDRFFQKPSHGLLLIGPIGAGKMYVAQYIAGRLLGLEPNKLAAYPYVKHIQPTKNTITIDQVRELNSFLSLKTTGVGALRRAVIIEDAHTMNIEAQNALLKLLEEPPADTVLILTTVGMRTLRPTIYSRLQQVLLHPVSREELTKAFVSSNCSEEEIARMYHIANGAIGLMSGLLAKDISHPLVQHIQSAKELLMLPLQTRLARIDQLTKESTELPMLLYAMKRVVAAALEQALIKQQAKQIRKWHALLARLLEAEQQLKVSANTKLVLTNLFLSV